MNAGTYAKLFSKPMATKPPPPPRPYTEYNIFFQIERAYILQNLGVIPDFAEENLFLADDPKYAGRPPLPARYDGIILPSDWYIPGKTKKKKRQHRASHGKISFTDLTKSISSAWRSIDNETKLFCAQLSDISNQDYKKLMMETRRASNASADSETRVVAARSTRGKRKSYASRSTDIAVSNKNKAILPTQQNQMRSVSTGIASSEAAAVTTHPYMFNMNAAPVNAAASNRFMRVDGQSRSAPPCVNMTDDDILGMYMSMKH